MPSMNVSLTDDLSSFVTEQLGKGYNNQSEVVRDGLRLLRARNHKLRDLQLAIAEGLASAAQGATRQLTDEMLIGIAERGRRRRAGARTTEKAQHDCSVRRSTLSLALTPNATWSTLMNGMPPSTRAGATASLGSFAPRGMFYARFQVRGECDPKSGLVCARIRFIRSSSFMRWTKWNGS